MGEIEAIKRALLRERAARKQAEAIIEKKSLEIYKTNQDLKLLNNSLEQKIRERTSEIEASRQQLLKAKEEAERSTKAKSLFLSNMSHEIRTPLNGIISITEIMLREATEPNIIQMLGTVKFSADHLLEIINDILDFSKIESGKVTVEHAPFNLKEVISNLKKVMQFRADEKGIDLIVEFDPEIPERVIGDKLKTNQMLTNLLGNAIKFTSVGYVKLAVKKLETKAEGEVQLEYVVSDTGIGIPKENLGRIFKSFTQSTQSITREFGGTGLGLTITKRLVELQNGTINVNSEENKGSAFFVRLGYKLGQSTHPDKKAPTPNEWTELNQKKVLIVEDNRVNQFVAAKILENWGVEIVICNNGVEAIKVLSQQSFDLILLDLHMPLMDGYETCAVIRDKSSGVLDHDVPVIALTADAFLDNKKQVLAAGMDDFATKPINQAELYEKMSALLRNAGDRS